MKNTPDELGLQVDECSTELKQLNEQIQKEISIRKRREEELLILQEVNNMINRGISPEKVFQTLVDNICSLYNYESVAMHLISKDRKSLIIKSYSANSNVANKLEKLTRINLRNYEVPLYEGSIFNEVIENKKPVITNDINWVLESYASKTSLKVLVKAGSRLTKAKWGMGVPLLAEDNVLGIIGCGSTYELTDEDSLRFAIFGAQAGLAIERQQIYNILEDKVEERTKELAESEEKYRSLIQTSTDPIISINAKRKITIWNNASENLFGYSKREAIGKTLDIIIHEKYIKSHNKSIKRFIKTEKKRVIGKNVEVEAKRKDGKLIPIELSISAIKLGDKYTFTAIIRDITKRKQDEGLMKQYIEELKTLGEIDKRIIKNQTISSLLKFIGEEAAKLTSADAFFFSLVEGDVNRIRTFYGNSEDINKEIKQYDGLAWKLFEQKVPLVVDDLYADSQIQIEPAYDNLRKAGMASFAAVPCISGQGETKGLLFVACKKKDMFTKHLRTLENLSRQFSVAIEHAKLNKEMKKAYKELKTLDTLKSDIISNVSHEIRTPITIVSAAIELLRDKVNPEERDSLLDMAMYEIGRAHV